jgi:hypothetical protein
MNLPSLKFRNRFSNLRGDTLSGIVVALALGSPRSLGETSASKSSSSVAFVATRDLRPPPGRRTRSDDSPDAQASSFKPRPIVLAAIPVARETPAMPPYPAARASPAAKDRRPRSSRCDERTT